MTDVPWYDRPLAPLEATIALARTRRLLEEMAREQESLGRELAAAGLTDFVERYEWLAAHRTPLEALAFEIKAARLAGWRPPVGTLAAPKPKRKYRRRRPPIVPADRQLEIAIAALEKRAREGAA